MEKKNLQEHTVSNSTVSRLSQDISLVLTEVLNGKTKDQLWPMSAALIPARRVAQTIVQVCNENFRDIGEPKASSVYPGDKYGQVRLELRNLFLTKLIEELSTELTEGKI